jgi:uncharacterized membrane protein
MPMDRCVKVYPVSEHELTTVGTFNLVSSFCIGIASIALGAAATVMIGLIQDGTEFTAAKMKVSGTILAILAFVAFVFYVAAIVATCFKRSEWTKIKSESAGELVAAGSQRSDSS